MTGAILPTCPRPACTIWTPHAHPDGTGILVAPIRTGLTTTEPT